MLDASCRLDVTRPPESAAGLRIAEQPAEITHSCVLLRTGKRADVDYLVSLERGAFTHDRIARRGFVRFLNAPNASLIVADVEGTLCGYALVLFRARSRLARLYSIAVDRQHTGRQLGSKLLRTAEEAACARGSNGMCLEVRESNAAAMTLYRKFGYTLLDRLLGYYGDGGNALRLGKDLSA